MTDIERFGHSEAVEQLHLKFMYYLYRIRAIEFDKYLYEKRGIAGEVAYCDERIAAMQRSIEHIQEELRNVT